jgi:hypothetical protein
MKSHTRCEKSAGLLISGLLLIVLYGGCRENKVNITNLSLPALSDEQIVQLADKKIFFGHQSVGRNIVQGIEEIAAADSRIKLKIVHSDQPQLVTGPALVEFDIGMNGEPQSKNNAFVAILSRGMGMQGGITLFKYCYVDFTPSTDVDKLFSSYQEQVTDIQRSYPHLKLIHVTVPLKVSEPAIKASIKHLLGRVTAQDLNAKRSDFNERLRKTYGGSQSALFDLAEVESTHLDGSRESAVWNGKVVYALAPEFTNDGGHLNALGRRVVATRFLQTISEQ